MKIKYINFGIAHTYNNIVFINKIFKNELELHKQLLDHEKMHIENVTIDYIETFNPQLLKFVLRHPSTWAHFMPIWIYDHKILWSKTQLFQWLLFLISFFFCLWWFYG